MRRLAVLLVAAAGLLTGCTDQQLTGSLGTVYPLTFDTVRARLYSSSLAVEYVREDGTVPVRLTVNRGVLDTAGTIDLLGNGDVTGRTKGDREIPRFTEGEVSFSRVGQTPGDAIEGSWSAKFRASETDTLGVAGKFSAPLEVVLDPGPQP